MKKVAILQSNYIPWKGYFDLINMVDEFIIYDDVQYTKNDWRNRNIIKTFDGVKWITIPVYHQNIDQLIKDTVIKDVRWPQKHLNMLRMNYSRAPYFKQYLPWLEDLYHRAGELDHLSQINYLFMTEICQQLGIMTHISWCWDYPRTEGKTNRLVELVKAAGGNYYLSGPAAKSYIETEQFVNAGVTLDYMDYSGYPEYPQLHGDFVHTVSILDLLFQEGPDAPKYMKSFRK
ncbi:MAG: WbqC family protein [Clostridiales bacterium]|nr:WbqC family protein [Clostridiales bacterium]